MKLAGVAIDSWKLAIFKKHLEASGFSYTVKPGITEDTLLLMVTYEKLQDLAPIVQAAQAECRSQ